MGKKEFTQYLLTEYKNIAEAHFKTIETISSFFRYYLIIMALPITFYSAFIGLLPKQGDFIYPLGPILWLFSFVIATIGFCVLLYIINLRMDALLYARTINAIRKHFYDDGDIDIEAKLRTRVLPQTASLPGYLETSYFLSVVTFAIFNTVYFSLSLILSSAPSWELTSISVEKFTFEKWVALLFTIGY